jgi:3-oxoacyl-[acyl-carrier-protein] synthase-3
MCGHLWGDGACAYFFSKENIETKSAKIIDVTSEGLGNIGMGTDGVFLTFKIKK